MQCARCDNEGTRSEWLVDGKLVPIVKACGHRVMLCEECHDYYEDLRKTFEGLMELGLSYDAANEFMVRKIHGGGFDA